jgi:hypothetical protein
MAFSTTMAAMMPASTASPISREIAVAAISM